MDRPGRGNRTSDGNHDYYGKTHHPYFSRDVMLYTIRSAKKPRWYIRYRLAGNQKKKTYYQKSLRTIDLDEAINRALKLWREIGTKEEQGIPIDMPSFRQVSEEMLSGWTLSNERKKYVRLTLDRYIHEYTDKCGVNEIGYRELENYVSWRLCYWERMVRKGIEKPPQAKLKPARNTIQKELSIIVQVLYFALRRGYIQSVPKVSPTRLTKSVEGKKTNANNMSKVYARNLRDRLKIHSQKKGRRIDITWARKMMHFYFRIAGRACLRAGSESQNIKIKHLQKLKHPNLNAYYYRINVTSGKVGQRVAILPIEYSEQMEALLKLHHDTYKRSGRRQKEQWCQLEDRHLWGYRDGSYKKIDLMQQNLRLWLTKWNMRHDPKFGRVTMYTFRSAQINNLLYNKKKTPAVVADIAGTSIMQIVNAYMSGDESDPSWALTASADYYDRMFGDNSR